ncbi:MAG: methyltransferase domain-containing protein [Bacteroidales bacterium]|nr:methyltransferase domain-containing protein [Bacteroidales bacterium]
MKTIYWINEKTKESYNLAAQQYHDLFHNELDKKGHDRVLLDKFSGMLAPGSTVCDAGCGPSAHIGKYLYNNGMKVMGVDISDKCIKLASEFNPDLQYLCEDFASLSVENEYFDGIISFYSIIHTPKKLVCNIFNEFCRLLKPGGYLLTTVKAGETEGLQNDLLGINTEIYVSLFTEDEIKSCYRNSGFELVYFESRKPYDFEIQYDRIIAIGRKINQNNK